jgi:hypothetical protein
MATSIPARPSATQCPGCHEGNAQADSHTEYFVDFHCASCGAVWSQPERRTGKRVFEKHSASRDEAALAAWTESER